MATRLHQNIHGEVIILHVPKRNGKKIPGGLGQSCPGNVWRLWDMMELQAAAFLGAVSQIRAIIVLIDAGNKADVLTAGTRHSLVKDIESLINEIDKLGARSALISANRLKDRLETQGLDINFAQLHDAMKDVESRFADHLCDIRLFALPPHEAVFMQSADELLVVPDQRGIFSQAYPNAAFEIEEAAKCCAFGRYTATVFHCMRAMESGISALCKLLGVPDATKPAQKNWGVILKAIQEAIDAKYPKANRMPNSMGARLESLYATLDAVKNPWRNATMHVENMYAPHEALHIMRCSGMFLLELSSYCDEEGRPPADAPSATPDGVATA